MSFNNFVMRFQASFERLDSNDNKELRETPHPMWAPPNLRHGAAETWNASCQF